MTSDSDILDALADAFAAASSILRERAARAKESIEEPGEFNFSGVVDRARRLHPQLGERQAEILALLAEAEPSGTDTGAVSRKIRYDQPNVYLTLQNLVSYDFAEKDENSKPHRYRLGKLLRSQD